MFLDEVGGARRSRAAMGIPRGLALRRKATRTLSRTIGQTCSVYNRRRLRGRGSRAENLVSAGTDRISARRGAASVGPHYGGRPISDFGQPVTAAGAAAIAGCSLSMYDGSTSCARGWAYPAFLAYSWLLAEQAPSI